MKTEQESNGAIDSLIACPECDWLMQKPVIERGMKISCSCCGYVLTNSRPHVVKRSLALVLTALLLYISAKNNAARQRFTINSIC